MPSAPNRTQYRLAASGVACLALLALAACQSNSTSRSSTPLSPSPRGGVTSADADTSSRAPQIANPSAKTVALVGDRAIGWNEITPLLAEAAGGQIVEEYALTLALQDECAKRSIRVTEQMVQSERRLLAQQLARAANLPLSDSETLITNIRRTRGLGDQRFRGLLERNAQLRALVRADTNAPITISADDIETAYQLKYGPKVKARLILTRSQDIALRAKQRLDSGQSFAEVAADSSLDPSASRGGVLDPFSLSDANYPVAVRRALQSMQPGQTSDAIAVGWGADDQEHGYAIVRYEQLVNASTIPPKDSVATELEQEVRLVRERAQMDRLGRQLIRSAGVSVMDRGLGWSWEQRRAETAP